LRRLGGFRRNGVPGSGASPSSRKRIHLRRAIPVGVAVAIVLWALLAYHWILIKDTGFVILKKTAWTLSSCVVIEQTSAMFARHYPVLTARITLGEGSWVFPDGR